MEKPTHALEKKLWLGCGALTALGLAALLLFFYSLRATTPQERDRLSATQVLQTRLNAIAVLLFSYEQTQDPDYLGRVKTEGEEITEALKHCQVQIARTEQAHRLEGLTEGLRSSIVGILSAETSQSGAFDGFLENLDSARTLLPVRSNPSVEMEELAKNLSLYLHSRSPEMLGAYRRAEQWLKKFSAKAINDNSSKQRLTGTFMMQTLESGHRVLELEKNKEEALAAYQKNQSELGSLLLEISQGSRPLPYLPMDEVEIWTGLLLFFGLVTALLTLAVALHLQLFTPLAKLTIAANAASTGDLSQRYSVEKWNEVGRISSAFNRLAGVLTRSENLIYHLATLVESSGEAIISLTLEGTILSWNKGAQRIYGYAAEEIKGRSLALLAPKTDPDAFQSLLEQIRRGQKIKPFEMNQEGKNGRHVHVSIRIACIYDSTRQLIGASLCLQDLPKIKPLPHQESISQPSPPVNF